MQLKNTRATSTSGTLSALSSITTLPQNDRIKISILTIESIKSLNKPGRFLKITDLEKRPYLWEEQTEKQALAKTSQALREGQAKVKKCRLKFTEREIENKVMVSRMVSNNLSYIILKMITDDL